MSESAVASDATALAAMIARQELSPLEAVDAAIARAEASQAALNFLVTDTFDKARQRAAAGGLTGPFAGVPYLVKNMTDVEGVVTRWGARFTATLPPATENSVQVKAMEAAGLVVIGTTSMGEMGFLATTEPLAFGPTRNPWDPARTPGGSSGGAAAAVAAGVVPMADAFDGGGSIRMPASACGLFGLKPSTGRLVGHYELTAGYALTAEHCISRSVRDSAALFAAMEESDAGLPPVGLVTDLSDRRLRVGYYLESLTGSEPDPEVAAATTSAAKLMESLGHHVELAKLPFDGPAFYDAFTLVWSNGAAYVVGLVGEVLGSEPDDSIVEPFTLALKAIADAGGPEGLAAAKATLTNTSAAYDRWFDQYDVILCPVLGQPPVPIGHIAGDVPATDMFQRIREFWPYTQLHNATGAPGMSVPLHWSAEGLPIGVHFAARRGDDRTLFELAYELEAANPWAHRRPPVFAG